VISLRPFAIRPARLALLGGLLLVVVPLPLIARQDCGGAWRREFRFSEGSGGDLFGWSVARIGDLDGDGVAEAVISAPFFSPDADGRDEGAVFVYSGSTGLLLRQFLAGGSLGRLGYSVADAGDLDGDGVDDLLIGAPESSTGGAGFRGSALVYSGATGARILQVDGIFLLTYFGASVAGMGDVDGDGVPDLLIGAPVSSHDNGATFPGSVILASGATGAFLQRFDGILDGGYFGLSVAAAGDVDGDGLSDVLIGAPFADSGGIVDAGSAFLFSSATGALLWKRDGNTKSGFFGNSVASAGDLDGDGIPEFLVGAPRSSPSGITGTGEAFVFSGATGSLVHSFFLTGPGANRFGYAVAGVADSDGDGVRDLLIGEASHIGTGGAHLFSGSTGRYLHFLSVGPRDVPAGTAVADMGDLDGDGFPEYLVGLAGNNALSVPGSARIYRHDRFLSADAGRLSAAAGGRVRFRLDYPLAEAGARYVLLGSLTGLGNTDVLGACVPIVFDAFTGRMLGNPPPGFRRTRGVLDAAGDAAASFTAAPGALSHLVGRRVFFAALDFDTKTATRFGSAALSVEIVP